MYRFFMSLKQKDGSFLVAHHSEVDVRCVTLTIPRVHLSTILTHPPAGSTASSSSRPSSTSSPPNSSQAQQASSPPARPTKAASHPPPTRLTPSQAPSYPHPPRVHPSARPMGGTHSVLWPHGSSSSRTYHLRCGRNQKRRCRRSMWGIC